ncbi:hypothetical protein EBZ70_01545 [bacterium]|nr:hypothetical protein [bacterium]
MHAPPSAVTLRLLACAEAFGREEDGAVGLEDWPALAELLDRELAVITRLAEQGPAHDPALTARATVLQERYMRLGEIVTLAQARVSEEMTGLAEASRRARSVQTAYTRS